MKFLKGFGHSSECHCVKSVRIRSYSGPYFPAFGLNKETHSVSPYSIRMLENTDQNNSEYGHFSRSVSYWKNGLPLDISWLFPKIMPQNIVLRSIFTRHIFWIIMRKKIKLIEDWICFAFIRTIQCSSTRVIFMSECKLWPFVD